MQQPQEFSELLHLPVVREAQLYEKQRGNKVKCNLCEWKCTIPPSSRGRCRTRLNLDGALLTLVYGDLSALESRPIEIKPFFHYWPGSTALTFSTWSCNFNCPWCQNHHLSKTEPNPSKSSHYFNPDKIINLALHQHDNGLCASFQEPTMLTDWTQPLFNLGHRKALYSCYVSNGYMTQETLKLLKGAGMTGLKIDIKGNKETYQKYCGSADVEKIWHNAHEAKKMGYHIEIVNLIVTGVNDDEETIRWIIKKHMKNLGADTPLHFTRYTPAYKFTNPPTQVETLEKAYNIAKKEGVNYPYVGNIQGHKYENTYCPKCDTILIQRFNYTITQYKLAEDKKCPKCGQLVPITGRRIKRMQTLV